MRGIKMLICLSILVIYGSGTQAQSSFQFGLLPAININKKLANGWKLNHKTESRQLLREGFFQHKNDYAYDYLLTDLSLLASKKIGLNKSFSNGYLIRLSKGEPIHRFIHQFAITQQFSGFRLGHRFVADETFVPDEAMIFRLRYRISTDFPLNGLSADSQEFYMKVSHEYLHIFQGATYDLELRLSPYLGYKFTDTNKLEAGLNYRIKSFLNATGPKNSFWVNINWYIAL